MNRPIMTSSFGLRKCFTKHRNITRIHGGWRTIVLLLLSLWIVRTSHAQSTTSPVESVNNETTTCQSNLYASDKNGDRRVDNEEYVTFVKLEGPEGFLSTVDFFVELPIMLQSNFYTLACLCTRQPNNDSNCCVGNNAHINTNGTAPEDVPTSEQAMYLDLVCRLTAQAIEVALEEQTSTPSDSSINTEMPSTAPTITNMTTAPTTAAPVTMPPSTFPSAAPTMVATTQTPTIPTIVTLSPSVALEPEMVIVRSTYSILVPSGAVTSIPSSMYEPDLIDAMDILSQEVANTVNETMPTDPTGSRRLQLWNDNKHQQYYKNHHHHYNFHEPLHKKRTRRRLEIVVDFPTAIVDISDVGFTTDPELIGGKFVRGPCPHDLGNSATDLCQEVTVLIELLLTSPNNNNPLLVSEEFVTALDIAILNGDLGTALNQVAPNSVVQIASGQESSGGLPPTLSPTQSQPDDKKSGLSAGAIAGIAAGALIVLLVLCYAFTQQQEYEKTIQQKKDTAQKKREEASQTNDDDPEAPVAVSIVPYESDVDDYSLQDSQEQSLKGRRKTSDDLSTTVASTAYATDSGKHDTSTQSNLGQELVQEEGEAKRPESEEFDSDSAQMLAATVPFISSPKDNRKVDSPYRIEIEGSEYVVPNGFAALIPGEARSTGNISHESEAGWSEAYTSSMGSVSDDELLPDPPPLHSVLDDRQIFSIGPNSPLSKSSPTGQAVSAEEKFGELENAILAGDWAAVGATAASMASMQETLSKSEISKSTSGVSALSSLQSKIDQDKAAQLDLLIEQGDWEGIVLAAASFEAEDHSPTTTYRLSGGGAEALFDASNHGVMVHEDSSDDEGESGYYSESHQSSRNSPKRSREELQAEISALVELVVPEEVDHVDEMLRQFAGREDELLETLGAMQERAEAQKPASGRSGKSIFRGQM